MLVVMKMVCILAVSVSISQLSYGPIVLQNVNHWRKGFPSVSVIKNMPNNTGNPGSIPGSGRSPGEGNSNPLQYSCLENSRGQRSLVGYSPWGPKELDTTKVTKQQQPLKQTW